MILDAVRLTPPLAECLPVAPLTIFFRPTLLIQIEISGPKNMVKLRSFIVTILVSLVSHGCGGGGPSTPNNCNDGQSVYTNFSYANAALAFFVGSAITPQSPVLPGVPSSCLPSTQFALASGSLPDGLSLDSKTGVISGVPTLAGPYTYRIQLTLSGFSGSVSNAIGVDVADRQKYTVSWTKANTNVPMTNNFRIDGVGSEIVALTNGFYSKKMDTYKSKDGGATWAIESAAGPVPIVTRFATTSSGSNLYFSGGVTETGTYMAGLWKYDGTAWVQKTSTGFTPRKDHAMVAAASGLYVIGGQAPDGNYLDDVWRSQDDGVTWSKIATPFSKRYKVCAVNFNGTLVVMGGIGSVVVNGVSSVSNLIEVWTSTDGVTWTQKSLPAGTPLKSGSKFLQQCGIANNRVYFSTDNPMFSSANLSDWSYEPFLLQGSGDDVVPGMASINGTLFFATGQGTSQRTLYRSVP
jgi:Putative Ig domain/Galactose oxidase, central domain